MNVARWFVVGSVLLVVGLTTGAVEITSVEWDSSTGVMVVHLEPFPAWGGWRMLVNGVEVPMEGGDGHPVVRPNVPLDQSPTALLIGTTPWLSPLPAGAMPCTGSLQFEIPGLGMTPVAPKS